MTIGRNPVTVRQIAPAQHRRRQRWDNPRPACPGEIRFDAQSRFFDAKATRGNCLSVAAVDRADGDFITKALMK
jgi:hypothetical protein